MNGGGTTLKRHLGVFRTKAMTGMRILPNGYGGNVAVTAAVLVNKCPDCYLIRLYSLMRFEVDRLACAWLS